MHKKSWSRLLGPLLMAAAAGVILSESAQAQQTGLFPLHPIKRKRVPCTQEDPVYRIYKDQYFGYHPTLWRKFPSGWGAPSPEAPDAKASFKEIPLQPPEWYDDQNEQGGDQDAAEGGQPAPNRPNDAEPNLPTPPGEDDRSPFEMDDRGSAPGLETPPRQQPAPRGADPGGSPFETPAPRAAAPGANAPALSPPTTSRTRRNDAMDASDAGSPLLAMPDASVDEAYEAPDLVGGPSPRAARHDHDAHAAGAQQAPRRGRLAAMMDGLGWNTRRR